MKRLTLLVLVVLVTVVTHPLARAQAPARTPSDLPARVAALESALRESLAQQGTLTSLAQDLQTQVAHLRQQLALADRRAGALADLDRMVAALEARLRSLRAELERGRQARLADRGAPAPGRFRAGYENGFFIASRDGRYRLTAGGLLRTVASVGEVVGASAGLEPDGRVDRVALTLPQAMLILDGNVFSTKLGFHLEAQLAGPEVQLLDLFLTYRPCRWFGIAVGQMPVGFSRQSDLWPYELIFSSGTEAAGAYGLDRELGVRLTFWQWQDRVFEEVSLWNGKGTTQGVSANLLTLMAQIRVGLAPLGPVPETEGDLRSGARPLRLLLTASYFYSPMPAAWEDRDGDGNDDPLRVHQVGLHASAYWAGAYLAGEVFYRHTGHPELAPPELRRRHSLGGYVQASYTLRRIWLSLAARYGYVEPVPYWRTSAYGEAIDWTSTMPDATGVAARAHEAALALVWHPFRPYLRIGLEYQWHRELEYLLPTLAKGKRQAHLANLWAQLRF